MSTVTDPIADLLARIRNGTRAQRPEVLVPYSRIKAEIARILKDEGYITDYSVDTSDEHPQIKIVATTLREVHSTTRHSWGAVAWVDGKTHVAPECELHVLDRVGGGAKEKIVG